MTMHQAQAAVVVGAGPAGLMAAEVLATAGLRVSVYEHMRSAGRKLILAGRGGLNITHSEPEDALLERYGLASEAMSEALSHFSVDDLRSWCAGLGQETFVGSSGRVFPESFRATPLLRAWLARLATMGVQLHTSHRWEGVAVVGQNQQHRFRNSAGELVEAQADVSVMALGGASWPRVGSNASWVQPLEAAGVTVSPFAPANCGMEVAWSRHFQERFEGTPIKDVQLSAGAAPSRGDMVVTTTGVEGGPVYAQSAALRSQTPGVMAIDLRPDIDVQRLYERLAKRRAKESASTWLRKAGFAPVEVGLLREVTTNNLPSSALDMAKLAKAVPLVVQSLMPLDRAISSAGGVDYQAIDSTLMLKALPGTFVAGEMLDWEAPTGGYLLQACFSTAVQAANGALAWLDATALQPKNAREARPGRATGGH